MSKQSNKPVSLILTAALVGGLSLSASAFAMNDLTQGYLLSAGEATSAGEGKAGEGKCGVEKMDTDKDGKVSQAEFGAAHKGDTSKFAAHDTNKDGFIDAAEGKTKMEGKCGEGKCGADKKKASGEGKCGGSV